MTRLRLNYQLLRSIRIKTVTKLTKNMRGDEQVNNPFKPKTKIYARKRKKGKKRKAFPLLYL